MKFSSGLAPFLTVGASNCAAIVRMGFRRMQVAALFFQSRFGCATGMCDPQRHRTRDW
ncbi:hypothetical protein AAZX31_13G091700 [Glycine max]|uniref:Uncharacterized protein n=1 Tax=Glycine max TaxID=3847 RepID=A0A0R0GVZ8_SOYBN|nr:hypothetical protein GYH30_035805 [Glycine max]KRH19269.1 hypothetical protein GLYMA_13G108700v4 [Glycine max]